ncbi:hypothetical protein BaRGS_00034549, partial [Batillaria attramentaria]
MVCAGAPLPEGVIWKDFFWVEGQSIQFGRVMSLEPRVTFLVSAVLMLRSPDCWLVDFP